MRMILAATLAIAPLAIAPVLAKDNQNVKRLNQAAVVFSEVMATPDKGIPEDLVARAHCIVIVPAEKSAAFLVGAKYGKGYVSCRRNGGWSAPGTVIIEGGSFGFQIGGSETDVMMLVMNQGGEDKLLSDKFTLGGEHRLPPGPWDVRPRRKPTFKCTRRFSPGRDPRACLRALRWKAPPCGRI